MKSPARLMVNRDGVPERVRRQPLCPILKDCGACTLLETDYKEQLKNKTEHLKGLIAKADPRLAEAVVKECVASPRTLAYRYSAKLVVAETKRDKQQWVSIGLYRPGTHAVTDIGRCPVQADAINEITGYLRSGIREFEIPVYNEQKKTGLLRYVVIRTSQKTKQSLVTFVTNGKGEKTKLRMLARELVVKVPHVRGVLQHVNESSGNAIFQSIEEENAANTTLITGENFLEDSIAGLDFRISSTSFFQVNPAVAELMYYRIAELAALSKSETALDLYCGVGAIGMSLAQSAQQVIGIDEVTSSIADANRNAEINNLKNIAFKCGQVEKLLPELVQSGSAGKVDVVTINPSRKGCEKNVLEQVGDLAPRSVLYMSCYPESLLRDLAVLADKGYKVIAFEPYDMFPGTHHYEVLAVAVRS